MGNREDDDFAAFERLMRPMPGWRRWLHAVWKPGFADYHAVQALRLQHPALYSQLPRETVDWWDRFGRRPQPSKMLLVCLFVGAAVYAGIMMLIAMDSAEGPLPWLPWTLFAFLAPVLIVLLKLYVVDWPTLLVYRRWGTRFSGVVLMGWLPLCVLNILAATWAHTAQVSTWPFVVTGLLLVLWSIYISGPVQVLHYAREDVDNRDVRVAFLNIIVMVWIWTLQLEPTNYRTPTQFALMLPLIAGSFARPLLFQQFQSLSRGTRRALLWIGLLAVIELFLLILQHSRSDEWKPWLVAAVLILVLFRRALPHGLLYFDFEWFGRILLIIGLVAASSVATSPALNGDSSSNNMAVTGMLLLVFGAILVIFAEFLEMRRVERPPRSEHGEV